VRADAKFEVRSLPMRALPFVLLLAACVDPQGGPTQNQSLGRTTGWFTQITPDNMFCGLSGIGAPTIDVTFYLGADHEDKDVSTLTFLPFVQKQQRLQQITSLQYGIGETVGGAIEVERGAAIIDPRLTDEVKATAIASHTSYYFPLTIHHLRLQPGHICYVDPVSGVVDPTDCIDVAEGSGLDDAHLWCNVAVNADLLWSE